MAKEQKHECAPPPPRAPSHSIFRLGPLEVVRAAGTWVGRVHIACSSYRARPLGHSMHEAVRKGAKAAKKGNNPDMAVVSGPLWALSL